MSWKSGSLNFLQPSGSHRACNGTPLPLPFFLYSQQSFFFWHKLQGFGPDVCSFATLKYGRCVDSKWVPSLCVCVCKMYIIIFIKIHSVLLSTAETNSSVKCIHILLKIREQEHLEDPCVEGRIILKGVFRKWAVRAWTGSNWCRIGTSGRHL